MRVFARASWCVLLLCAVALPGDNPAREAQATVSSSPESRIVPPPQNYRFPNGETYVFSAEWHMFNAGTARVKMEPEGNQQRVTVVGDTAGMVSAIIKVHDRVEARFVSGTFCSQQLSKAISEGSHQRQTNVRFDYTRHKSVLDEKNLKTGEQKHEENDIPGCVTDVMSGFYYLASLPLQTGSSYTFPVNDGGKTADAKADVEGREDVKVPAGSYRAIKVQAEAISGPLKGKGHVTVWFSDDSFHKVVQMKSKLGWGTLVFKLQRVEKD